MDTVLMFDLFCGYKGASAAMRKRGWDVVTVDIMASFDPTFVADLRRWSWTGPTPDLIWASPPCQEFSRHSMPWTRAKQPKRPDLSLVIAALRIVQECKPRWWVLENVRGATRWLGPSVRSYGPYHLWGQFPRFDARVTKRKESFAGWKRQERALVPLSISMGLALACEQALAAASWPTHPGGPGQFPAPP